MRKLIILSAIVILQSCAGVKVYTDESCTKDNEVGLKFYQPKPFLLVEYNPAKDVNIKTSIVYLPDISSPRYVKVKNGWGSANATIGFANGVMNSFGAISDSKGPETIAGLASAVTSLGGAALSLAQVDEIHEKIKQGIAGTGEQAGGDEETIKIWEQQTIKLDLIIGEKISSGDNQREATGLSKLKGANGADENERKEIIKTLKEQLKFMQVPTLAKRDEIIKSLLKNAKRIKELDLIDPDRDEENYESRNRIVKQLEEIAKAIQAKETEVTKHWELFELVYENNELSFKKVELPSNDNEDK